MLVNIRGTNGSGKSTIIKRFLQHLNIPIHGAKGARFPEAYCIKLPKSLRDIYVIGPYVTNTGGLDALGMSLVDTIALLEKYNKRGHVLFEGVIVSTTFGAVGRWLQEKHRDNSVVAFLDTPLDVCLKSVSSRTGDGSRTEHVASKHRTIAKLQDAFRDAGVRVEIINRETGFETVKGWFK